MVLLRAFSFRATAEDFTNAIHAFLQQRVEVERRDVGIVVGIVDENGSRVVSCGKLDKGTAPEVNGDTVFEIHSITKTFTGLLLQDMIQRGEMKLDEPVAKYLPKSVRMPARSGKEITLLQLVTHTSGLPREPDNLNPKHADDPFADYTFEELYAFLSGYKSSRDPGAKFEYSNLGAGLLGDVIALKAGTDYESLVVDRICRPLKMDSTRVTLTPELESRFANGHNRFYGDPVGSFHDSPVFCGAGGLHSSANDLLKYLSANLGLTPSSLTPLMEKTHAIHFQSAFQAASIGGGLALPWFVVFDPQGREIIHHAGNGVGSTSFVGFDKTRRRGVVVLSNSQDPDVPGIGFLLLESEWQSDRRPKETKISSHDFDSYVGQYRISPDFGLGMLAMRMVLFDVPKAVIYIPAALCLAVLTVILWRARNFRRRCIILGCAVLVSVLLAALSVPVLSRVVCTLGHPGMGIRREGDRIFARVTLSPAYSNHLPPDSLELWPESEDRFFDRLLGMPVIFYRDGRGKVTRLSEQIAGATLFFRKISDQPPKAFEPLKPHVPIKLDPKLLDACVGHYEIAPPEVYPIGTNMTIWREGDQLVGQAWGTNGSPGSWTFDIYPESETNFFIFNGTQLNFLKDDKGTVTAVIAETRTAAEELADRKGKKLKNK